MNEGYEETKPVSQALLSRCQQIIEFELPKKQDMIKRIQKDFPLEDQLLDDMVETLFDVRTVVTDESVIDGICSYRELYAWAQTVYMLTIMDGDANIYEAAVDTIVSHATRDKDVQANIAAVVSKRFSEF